MTDDLDDAWAAIVIEERAEVLRLRKRIEELEGHVSDLLVDVPCACGYDNPTDVCMKHFPLFRRQKDRIEELQARAEAAEAKLAEAVEDKQDAIDTLNAWFDRRKLCHEAVDQAIVDAASGYLRTSRVGGMPQKESDLVLGVIQDMARLGLFADLFARTTLAELGEDKNDE